MKTLFRSFFLLCLFLIPLITAAQNSSADAAAAVNQIFDELPMEQRLTEAPQQLYDLFSQNPFELQSSQNQQVLDQFNQAFSNNSLLNSARGAFEDNYEAESVDSTLRWTQRTSTNKVLDAENEFYTLQGIRKRVVHEYELEQNPPSQDRVDLIKSVVQNMTNPESEIESRTIIFRSMLSALNEVNGQQLFNNMQMEGMVGNYRSQLESQIDQELTNRFMIMYYGLEDETLKNYSSFYKSGAGNWLTTTTTKSFQTAYKTAANRFLQSIRSL